MYEYATSPAAELDDQAWAAVHSAVRDLEKAWQAQGRADLSSFAPPLGDRLRERVLIELIKVDQEYRWESGENKSLEGYLDEWPELAAKAAVVKELLAAECLTRAFSGSAPMAEELQSRFPDLCQQIDLSRIEADAEKEIAQKLEEASRLLGPAAMEMYRLNVLERIGREEGSQIVVYGLGGNQGQVMGDLIAASAAGARSGRAYDEGATAPTGEGSTAGGK